MEISQRENLKKWKYLAKHGNAYAQAAWIYLFSWKRRNT